MDSGNFRICGTAGEVEKIVKAMDNLPDGTLPRDERCKSIQISLKSSSDEEFVLISSRSEEKINFRLPRTYVHSVSPGDEEYSFCRNNIKYVLTPSKKFSVKY